MKISMKREQNSACIGSAEREKFGAKLKTKNIFNLLALAMLMPAMLLTTACSNDDDAVNNTENTAKKGYELPVTVNVTRQGDDAITRATYNGTSKKLEFSTGDQLFVKGKDTSAGGAGFFAGTLTWQSGGTFSGTILTEKAYSGTIDALFTAGSALATLLPAYYGNYSYLSFTSEGTYEASVNYNTTKTFATSKAIAVEQFSFEDGGYTSGTGFALAPRNAILNFTITGLAANTEFAVAFSDGVSITISGNVTTDDSGTATFAIAVSVGTDLNEFSLTVGGTPITLVSSNKVLEAGKIYNITRNAIPGALVGKFSVSSTKQVYFSKGNLQATYNGSAWSWAFAAHQWDYIGNAAANTSINGNGTVSANGTVDLFGWVGASSTWTGSAMYGISNSTTTNSTDTYGNVADEALKSDWGATMGTGWRTLTKDEWSYLLNTRSITNRYCKATVNSKNGLVIFPDSYSHPSGPAAIASANTANAAFTTNSWSADDWAKMEAAGAVFLPAAGLRDGTSVHSVGFLGIYWSSTPNGSNTASLPWFNGSDVAPASYNDRYKGGSVRLVRNTD